MRRFDGMYRWFLIRASALRDESGKITKWYGTNFDIEELKQAQQELKKRERDLKLIIDTIPALVACDQADGTIEFRNRRWHEYTGVTPEESFRSGWQTAFHPDDLPALMKWRQELLASSEANEIEARMRRHDGVYRWFLVRSEPFRDDVGNIVRWYGTSTDIDDWKQVEGELRRNEAFLAKAQRLSSTGCFSWCLDNDEIKFSDEAYRLFGFEPGTPVSLEEIATRIHPDDIPLLVERTEAARSRGVGHDYEIRLVMPDGTLKYLHTTSNETGRLVGRREYIGAIQDVTQRRIAQEALYRAQAELAHVSRITSLGALTASMAHEINQPLSGVITNAGTCLRLLNADPPNVDGARETVRRTIRDCNRATDVITRLRALFGKKEFTLESMDLNDAAREIIELTSNDLQRNRVVVQFELAGDLPSIDGDRVQLQQVILNLVRNASEAMADINDRQRRLLIKTESDGEGAVRLSVRDAGVGFVEQNLEKVFDSFYTTKNGGMGIGLSVSRSIIEKHQGRLWAESNDGPGATFTFSIPCGTTARVSVPATIDSW